MIGSSWGGFNALQIAALRPPALAAIITNCSTDDRYADDMHYMGGSSSTTRSTGARRSSPACPGRPIRRSRARLAAEVAGAARAVRAAAGRVAPAPAAGRVLEARLGQRGLRRDPVPRLRDRRLDGRLLERDPAAARAPHGAAPRAHRRLGSQVRPPGRPGAGDRLSPGVSPLVGPLAPGPGHRDHAGAHAARLHAGGGAAARRLPGLPRPLGGRAGLAPARAEDPAPPPRRGRRAPGPRRARRHPHAPVGADGRPRGRRVVSPRDRRLRPAVPHRSARGRRPEPRVRDRRRSAARSRSWASRPCRSRSPSTSRWRSWRSGSTTSFPTAACPGSPSAS